MKSIVISLGGSVLFSEDDNEFFLKKISSLLVEHSKKYKIYIVVGGGKTARTYIKKGRDIGLDEKTLDSIGIDITRINARFLANIIKIANQKIPHTTDQAKKMSNNIIIMGGTNPGHSTDMVGAELAKKTNSIKYIIATNVDGIYDKDPNKYQNAKKIDEISIKKLIKKYGTCWDTAGKNMVIDGPALDIINKAKIKTYVINGKKINQIKKAITNGKINGTKIKK